MSGDKTPPPARGSKGRLWLLAGVVALYLIAMAIGFVIGDQIGGGAVYGLVGVLIALVAVMLGFALIGGVLGLRRWTKVKVPPAARDARTGQQESEDRARRVLKLCGICMLGAIVIYCLSLLINYLILGHTRPTSVGTVVTLAVMAVFAVTVGVLGRRRENKH